MMNLNSPLFDKVRSKPVADEPRAEEGPRCEHPGCARKGEFRAPKGRVHEGEFFRFCLDHVREYNQSYNYFAGMSEGAVQNYQKDALTGHRPTWTVGVNGGPGPESKLDAATLLRARLERLRKARAAAGEPRRRVGKLALKALEALGLDENADRATIRRRFKDLAKRLHPDLNEGDRSREDKLRAIIDAYNYLKSEGLA
ncbi:J domain-containing protein [Rhabdaerophilum calidifontis]|uniref:J domain-containing protein n=1 Tax=Rhabdaerophilum calidifontis TaxID=2604328 RepID=UPI00319E5B38